jgi:hypothetical protein
MRPLAPSLLTALFVSFIASPPVAQDAVPDRRVAISRDVDFYGQDLANIFDTTLDACQAACLADARCTAFTFNQRSNACFPKSGVGGVSPFQGAVSGRVLATDPAILARQPDRIELVRTPREMTLEAFHQAYPSTIDLATVGTINRLRPGDVIPSGTLLKRCGEMTAKSTMVVMERQAPPKKGVLTQDAMDTGMAMFALSMCNQDDPSNPLMAGTQNFKFEMITSDTLLVTITMKQKGYLQLDGKE